MVELNASILNSNPADDNQPAEQPEPQEVLDGDPDDSKSLRALTVTIADVIRKAGEQALRLQLRPHSTHARQDRPGEAYTSDASDKIRLSLRDALIKVDPLDGFWEDGENRKPGGRYWSLCPLDGVINYARNLSEWTITVAIIEINAAGEVYPILGVVHAPALDVTYLAARGVGALRIRRGPAGEEKREQVIPSATSTLDGSVLCFGMSYFPSESQRALTTAAHMAGHPADIKRIGPASLDLCKVADGTYDAYFEPALHSWDVPAVAAATIIVWEAQGTLERWDGGMIRWDSNNDILATNGLVRAEIRSYLTD